MRPLVLAPQTKKLAKSSQKSPDFEARPSAAKATTIGLARGGGGGTSAMAP